MLNPIWRPRSPRPDAVSPIFAPGRGPRSSSDRRSRMERRLLSERLEVPAMTRLIQFLSRLAKDYDLQQEFFSDPQAVLLEQNLSRAEIELLLLKESPLTSRAGPSVERGCGPGRRRTTPV